MGLYTLQRLLYSMPTSNNSLLLSDFNLYHSFWNNAMSSSSQLVDIFATWLQNNVFNLLVDLKVINSKGGTFLRS